MRSKALTDYLLIVLVKHRQGYFSKIKLPIMYIAIIFQEKTGIIFIGEY